MLRPRITNHNAIPWLSNWFHAGLLSSPLARPQNPRHPPQNPDQTSKSQQTMKSWQGTILHTQLKHRTYTRANQWRKRKIKNNRSGNPKTSLIKAGILKRHSPVPEIRSQPLLSTIFWPRPLSRPWLPTTTLYDNLLCWGTYSAKLPLNFDFNIRNWIDGFPQHNPGAIVIFPSRPCPSSKWELAH